MVNTDKLKQALRAKGLTIDVASSAIGINPATFYRKVNKGGTTFTVAEVSKFAELLNMDGKALSEIFFDRTFA